MIVVNVVVFINLKHVQKKNEKSLKFRKQIHIDIHKFFHPFVLIENDLHDHLYANLIELIMEILNRLVYVPLF